MATNRPRLTVSLRLDTYHTIRKLAKYQKRAMSSVISEAMDEMQPIMSQLVSLVEKAHNLEKDMFRPFAEEAEDLHNDARATAHIFSEILTELEKKLDEKSPPPCNTGGKTSTARRNTGTTKKRKGKKSCTKPATKTH